jgi:hypothetical protein
MLYQEKSGNPGKRNPINPGTVKVPKEVSSGINISYVPIGMGVTRLGDFLPMGHCLLRAFVEKL